MAMAVHGNKYALLGGDDDVENLIYRFAAAAKVEGPPSAVEKRKGNRGTASSALSSKNSSKSQRPFDHERGRNNGHGLKGQYGNGQEINEQNNNRSVNNRDDFKRNTRNGANGQANRGGNSFQPANGYRPNRRPENGNMPDRRPKNGNRPGKSSSKQHEEQLSDSQKKEEVTDDGDGWQVIRRRNPQFGYSSNEVVGDVGGSERNNDRMRENGSWSEANGFSKKQHQDGRKRDGEKPTDAKVNKDEKQYIIRNINSGEGKDERKDDGKKSDSMEVLKERGEANNEGSKGAVAAAVTGSKESESKRDQRMTLKDYEKKVREKRKVLETMKTQEQRVVTADKDFESMRMIEKKEEEAVFIKLNSANDKPKKKATPDKNNSNGPTPLVTNSKPTGTNYFGKRGGRFNGNGREENGDGGYSVRKGGTGNNNGNFTSGKKEKFPVLSEDGGIRGYSGCKEGNRTNNGNFTCVKKEEEFPALSNGGYSGCKGNNNCNFSRGKKEEEFPVLSEDGNGGYSGRKGGTGNNNGDFTSGKKEEEFSAPAPALFIGSIETTIIINPPLYRF